MSNSPSRLGSVVSGEDLLAVDAEACQLAQEVVPSYISNIRQMR